MKKSVVAVLVTVLFMSLLSGCTSAEVQKFGLDVENEVELNVVGELENFEGLEAVITKFEEQYPNCNINYIMLDEYDENLSLRLENEKENTQMFLSTSSTLVKESIKEYALNFYEEGNDIDISDTNANITQSQEMDGALYTIPLAENPRGMLVNKTLLAKCGVEVPQNWEEFLNVCEVLKQNGYIPIQANVEYVGIGLMYSYYANTIIHNENYEQIYADMNEYKEGSSQYIEDICTRVNTLVENGYIVYDETADWENNYDVAIMNFFEGDVAFFPATAETVSGMAKREERSEPFTTSPFEYEFVCAPVGDDGAYCYWTTWQGISINKEASNIEWAKAFVQFLVKEENLALLASTKGMPSNTAKETEDERFQSLYQIPEEHVAESNMFQIKYYSLLNKTLQKMVLPMDDPERMDVQGAMEYFEQKMEEKRNEGE